MWNSMKQLVMSWWAPRPTQRQRILAMLLKGPATNRQLSRVAPRFGARVHELREAGWDIYSSRDGAKYYYTLVRR